MTTPRRGRRTKEEEAHSYLASMGIDPHEILGGVKARAEGEVPEPEQMLDEFLGALYNQMKLGELKSTALVQGLKAIESIAAKLAEKNGPVDDGPVRGVDEVLADAGLPADRRLDIGRKELERLNAQAAALELVLERIGGEHDGLAEPAALQKL